MSWLSSFLNKLSPPPPAPKGVPIPQMPVYSPPPVPQMPQLPQIILNAPQPQPMATMPSMGGSAAGKGATAAAMNRAGRASTILTSKKKRRQDGGMPTFDSYAGTSLGS